jgi:hypothetical protein
MRQRAAESTSRTANGRSWPAQSARTSQVVETSSVKNSLPSFQSPPRPQRNRDAMVSMPGISACRRKRATRGSSSASRRSTRTSAAACSRACRPEARPMNSIRSQGVAQRPGRSGPAPWTRRARSGSRAANAWRTRTAPGERPSVRHSALSCSMGTMRCRVGGMTATVPCGRPPIPPPTAVGFAFNHRIHDGPGGG